MRDKKWEFRSRGQSSEKIRATAQKYSIPPLLASILLTRDIDDIDEFLNPDLSRLEDPFRMKGMEEAVCRILSALSAGERIMVYGDYDVDGITSTACMVRFLRSHHADVSYYIPDRKAEGYGMNHGAVETIAREGCTLIITVDCGITAVDETAYAKSLGVDVIVTDHHECKDELPDAYCIVNPKQPGCPYPFKKLAGVGVAFKLLQALTLRMKFHLKELYEEYMDIVAVGTVADVMPLVGENRIIVKKGLELINFTFNRGLRSLKQYAGVAEKTITAGTIGFTLAPRINAAGRVGDPKMAVEMLLSSDDMTADRLAGELDAENKQRQASEQAIYDEAVKLIEEDPSYQEDSVLVLAHPGWHHGVIGIVASKISELYYKPAILISTEGGFGKGSGRSIASFNLFEALASCADSLDKFGGHKLAAGLSIREENIGPFRSAINSYAREVLTEQDFIPKLRLDCELPIEFVNLGTVDRLSMLEPFGTGNPNPVFAMRGVTIHNIRPLSEGKHIKLTLIKNNYLIDSVGFGMGEYLDLLAPGGVIDIAFSLDANVFRGERLVQVLLKDIHIVKQGGES